VIVEKYTTVLPGCFELQPRVFSDPRGVFVKTFHRDVFKQLGLATEWAEQYYSISEPGVVRGIHFQRPPDDHAKLVYCIAGSVLDIVLDLRMGSPTYGKHIRIELNARLGNMLYIPSGLAHGFCTYDDTATLVYNVTSVYEPSSDSGIRWDSAGIEWPCATPKLSERDRNFPTLAEFISPFQFESVLNAEPKL